MLQTDFVDVVIIYKTQARIDFFKKCNFKIVETMRLAYSVFLFYYRCCILVKKKWNESKARNDLF